MHEQTIEEIIENLAWLASQLPGESLRPVVDLAIAVDADKPAEDDEE